MQIQAHLRQCVPCSRENASIREASGAGEQRARFCSTFTGLSVEAWPTYQPGIFTTPRAKVSPSSIGLICGSCGVDSPACRRAADAGKWFGGGECGRQVREAAGVHRKRYR
jgi:hypothetical protein